MIGGQGEDSCGNSGTDETPQARKRRGGSSAARGKRSLARKLTAMQQAIHTRSFIPFVRLSMEVILLCLGLFSTQKNFLFPFRSTCPFLYHFFLQVC
ncbi:hypothetical protein QJ133_11580 [Priestia megaterium]|uniref:hypothetical protein n=1 Tax=Priestia megaterium TaxID=1404 RepID=UPI00249AF830|nr:hypothetical protein [Priestia megaterium]MDI3091764.1 hypothetical protein [Priestia megaterium]